jgi:uncharacterized RDD family membrane protein YckC
LSKPDFAKYSENQLRQILTRIDKERFPERVQEIQERLGKLEAERLARTNVDEPKPDNGPPQIAGFWRRTGAFLIDSLVIGLVGFLLGLLLGEQFEAMGAWGRAVGFLVALGYFGTMESRLFQGCTFGKLAMDIRIVTSTGAPLGVVKALFRSAVFCVPYFLNNVGLGAGYTNFVLPAIQALFVFGLGGAIAYLYVFNRRTRQSVHDLLVGAVVVRSGAAMAPRLLPVWRGHMVAIATLFVLAIGAIAYSYSMLGNGGLQPLMLVQRNVSRLPGVRDAGIFEGTSFATGGQRMTFLTINAMTIPEPVDEKTLAHNIAEIALNTYPPAQQLDTLSVTLIRGFDIGIASSWNAKTFNAPPHAWREKRRVND